MNMTRKALTTTAALGALTLALTGCSGSSSQTADTDWSFPETAPEAEISVLSILDLQADGAQEIVDAFNEEYPSITVDWRTVAFDDVNSAVDSQVSSANGEPDVYWADQPRIAALAARGLAADLTHAFADYEDEFDPEIYDSGVYEDSLWALPITSSTQLLYYNADLLDAADLPHPSSEIDERMTWEELIEDAIVAREAGAQYGFSFGQPDTYYQLQPLAEELGGSNGISEGDELVPDVTSDEWVEAMDWYQSIYERGASPRGALNNYADVDPAFANGQIAYAVEGPWLYLELVDSDLENWGVAPQPAFEDGEAKTATGSFSLAMNPHSTNKEAAAVFMRWMAVENGFSDHLPYPELPGTETGKQNYFEREAFDGERGREAAEIMNYESAETAVGRPKTVGYIELETIMGQAFSDIRNGTDVRQALEDAQEQVERSWVKYQ